MTSGESISGFLSTRLIQFLVIFQEKYLQGIGIIDRQSKSPCIRSLVESTLPTNILDRLKTLFSTKDKWTLDEIEPYIQ